MKKQLFLFTAMLMGVNVFAQNLEWAKSMGGTDFDQGFSIAVDAAGNVYTTGLFKSTVDFDPGLGVYNLSAVGDYDIFITKFDALGNFRWAKAIGGPNGDVGFSIAVDGPGNVYMTGEVEGSMDFDPGPGTFMLNTGGICILKLDTEGNFMWAKRLGGTTNDIGRSIAVDASGNVYTTGYFEEPGDFDPGPAVYTLSESFGFISKLDAAGNFVWAKGIKADPYALALDANGNVYTTGRFGGQVDFDPSPDTFMLSTLSFSNNLFILKLDASGNFVWAKGLVGTDAKADGNAIALDAEGNVYTTGNLEGELDFDPGPGIFNLDAGNGHYKTFISKLNTNGSFIWAGMVNGDYDSNGRSIVVDASGNMYATGYFSGTCDFDMGTDTFNLVSTAGGAIAVPNDIFILKLDEAGHFVWAKNIGGNGYDDGVSITVDVSGNIYLTGDYGYYENTVDFNPGPGTFNMTPVGASDIFVLKLNQTPTGTTSASSQDQTVRIYPNPAENEVYLQTSLSDAIQVALYDNMGRLVQSEFFERTDHQDAPLKLNVETLPKGAYFVKISDGKSVCTGKLVK